MSHIDCIHPDEDEGDGGCVLGDSFAFQESGDMRELPLSGVEAVTFGGNVSARLSNENHQVLDNDEDYRGSVLRDRGNVKDREMQTATAGAAGVGSHVGSPSAIAPVNHAYLCLNVTDCIIRPAIIPFVNSRLENAYQSHARGDNSDTIDLMSPDNEVPVSGESSTSVTEHIVESSCL
ncbi:hypothetical protein Tco_0246328 [Tanacetum coccineum]